VVQLAWRSDPGSHATESAGTAPATHFPAAPADPVAFDDIYDRYADAILNYCFHRLGTWEEAEDAAQQIFVNAYRALPRFQVRDGSLRSWLFTVAHNEIANRHRYQARHRTLPLTEAAAVFDPAPLPEEMAVVIDQQERLRRMLPCLSEDQRRVVELRLAGLRDGEIAAVLGRSPGAVRGVQARAVARLRDLRDRGPREQGATHG
jgi:RNA polymerase sigma-70 factor (ECF subfamily)